MPKKIILLPIFIIIAFAAGFIFMLKGCLQKHNNYGVVGMPAASADGNFVVVVVAENEATTYSENPTYRKTTYSTSYWLKQYETATGKLLKKKKLIGHAELNNRAVASYGAAGNNIWLHIDKLRAYDINTLEEATNEEKIAAANGMGKQVFPYEDRLMRPAVEKGYIDFTNDNGDEYRLLLDGLKIKGKASLPNDESNEERNINRLLHNDDYGTRSDTLNNKMYILAKDSSLAANTSPNNYSLHETAYRMKLFAAGYTVKKFGPNDSYAYGNIYRVGDSTYLNPCFAKDMYHDAVIHLSSPDGFLLIHQDVLGEKSKAVITRIDTNGKKVWESAIGASTKIENCILGGKYFIISTNKDYMFSPHAGKDALCIINIENGNTVKALLNE